MMKRAIAVVALLAAGAAHGAPPTPAAQLRSLQGEYAAQADGGIKSVKAIDALLTQLDQLPLQQVAPAVRRGALVLRVELLLHKYSLLESPDFANNKGGVAVLQSARALCQQWLDTHPADLDVLGQLYNIQVSLRVPVRATIDKMLAADPNNSFARELSSINYDQEDKLALAMQEILRATSGEKVPSRTVDHMQTGISYARRAECRFADALQAIVDALPPEAVATAAEPVARKGAPEAPWLAALTQAKTRYLKTYDVDQCLATKK
ncbi:hypothetical protein [Massilia sp. CF038]|uniref:hypothetical protein n=1 Tax=Massilia sp. CF038 TaxID=1881045 RepID=UPI00091ED96B|nr:hypothetical protein [Massilia sp. CF038]SHG67350.1 hypothetical protein SAMN05428948_1550 [Massilia sp. CF038]